MTLGAYLGSGVGVTTRRVGGQRRLRCWTLIDDKQSHVTVTEGRADLRGRRRAGAAPTAPHAPTSATGLRWSPAASLALAPTTSNMHTSGTLINERERERGDGRGRRGSAVRRFLRAGASFQTTPRRRRRCRAARVAGGAAPPSARLHSHTVAARVAGGQRAARSSTH